MAGYIGGETDKTFKRHAAVRRIDSRYTFSSRKGGTPLAPCVLRGTGYNIAMPIKNEIDFMTERNDKQASRVRRVGAIYRDVGELPPVVSPSRRLRASRDFQFFCEAYFPDMFSLKWSNDHISVLQKMEKTILFGGQYALAMPRGSGKTTIAECACIWASINGHREFSVLIGADLTSATQNLDNIKSSLENNDLLLEDYPEICYPIKLIEGISARARTQTYLFERTNLGMLGDEISIPTIKPDGWADDPILSNFITDEGYSVGSGAILRIAGITGRIRGMSHVRPDGKKVRPSFVILDDPQTDESAKSMSQIASRERIINGAIMGLAGPGKKIACVMPCTVIRIGDLADRFLDGKIHPEWNGTRTKLLNKLPTNDLLWEEYRKLRFESLQAGKGLAPVNEFYVKNRAELDKGAVPAWPERFNSDEVSAIQHAMNLRFTDERSFFAEYQNQPISDNMLEEEELSADLIMKKLSGIPRGVVPRRATRITSYIDVQKKSLWYVVCAWADDFTGYVIDYGTFPDEGREYFTLREQKNTLQLMYPGQSLETQLYSGLTRLVDLLAKKRWPIEGIDDGDAAMSIDRILIDANWNESTEVVYQFCKSSPHFTILVPSHGKYVGAGLKPMREWAKRPGERRGMGWLYAPAKKGIKTVTIDTNMWKSFVANRLCIGIAEHGSLSLFGKTPNRHQLFADHIMAEYRVRTSGYGRVVDEWKLRPGSNDNHWLDGLTGCAVAAAMQGLNPEIHMMKQAEPSASSPGDEPSLENKEDPVKYHVGVPTQGQRTRKKRLSIEELKALRAGRCAAGHAYPGRASSQKGF